MNTLSTYAIISKIRICGSPGTSRASVLSLQLSISWLQSHSNKDNSQHAAYSSRHHRGGHSSAGGECPWSRQGLLGAALKMACSGGGRSIPCMSPGLSWAGMEVGHGVRTGRWALPENHHHHLLWFSWDSGNKELHRKTNVPDVSCPHIIVNSVSFPHFHSCNLPSSLLGHRFSFFLFLTRYSSTLR